MNLTMTMLIFFLILPLITSIFVWRKKRMIAVLALMIPCLLFLSIGGFLFFEKEDHFVRSSNLKEESISEISLNDSFNRSLKQKLGSGQKIENILYKESYRYENLYIGVDEKEKIKIIDLSGEGETGKGIKIGDPLEKVKQLYGNHYAQMSQYDSASVVYLDRKDKIEETFIYSNDRVTRVILKSV